MNALNQHSNFILLVLKIGCCVFITWYDLLQRFFVIDPSTRLGSLARGIDEIYSHLWYDSIDFDALRHKDLTAPWVPKLKILWTGQILIAGII